MSAKAICGFGWERMAVAIAALVSVLTAPVCAPLCAGSGCPAARTKAAAKADCHGAAGMHQSAPAMQIGAVKACGLAQLPVAMVNAPGNARAGLELRHARPETSGAVAEQMSSLSGESGARWCEADRTAREEIPSTNTISLRI